MMRALAARIPLNTFAITFGLAGLSEVWTLATDALALTSVVEDVLWSVTAVAWVWLIAAHAIRGARSGAGLVGQLRDRVQGPTAALVPIVGMLLATRIFLLAPGVGRAVFLAFLVGAALFAAWLISTWMADGLAEESIHGGYFLPTVAGGLIASTAAAELGMDALALGAFAVGAFFWVVMAAIILARLMRQPALPAPLIPTMAIFVAPPAVAGTAWFLLFPTVGPIEYGLAAITVMMLLVQLALVPRYRMLPFTLGFWSFTFPFAAVGGYGIQWLILLRPTGWQVVVIAITAGITVLIGTIAANSIRVVLSARSFERVAARDLGGNRP
jgi:tellurite resistance protein